MTLLETAQGLKEEQLDAWYATLSLEEKKKLIVQSFEDVFELLDRLAGSLGEETDGQVSSDDK